MRSNSPRISIVIPCHNEQQAAAQVLSRILSFQIQSELNICEIIVVDDGSTDATPQVLNLYPSFRQIKNNIKLGYGAALKKGFASATGDLILFMDLDDTYQIQDLEHLIQPMQDSSVDIVFGCRLQKKSGMPRIRFMGNHFYALFLQVLGYKKIKDPCTGMRLFRANLRENICQIKEDDFSFSMSLSLWVLKTKLNFREIQISYDVRSGESKLNVLLDGWRFFWTIVKSLT